MPGFTQQTTVLLDAVSLRAISMKNLTHQCFFKEILMITKS